MAALCLESGSRVYHAISSGKPTPDYLTRRWPARVSLNRATESMPSFEPARRVVAGPERTSESSGQDRIPRSGVNPSGQLRGEPRSTAGSSILCAAKQLFGRAQRILATSLDTRVHLLDGSRNLREALEYLDHQGAPGARVCDCLSSRHPTPRYNHAEWLDAHAEEISQRSSSADGRLPMAFLRYLPFRPATSRGPICLRPITLCWNTTFPRLPSP